MNLLLSPKIIELSKRMKWAEQRARVEKLCSAYRNFVGIPARKGGLCVFDKIM